MEQTFREYTEQRISDYKILSTIMPETFTQDVSKLRNAYAYEDNLLQFKNALSIILKREITWKENDEYQSILNTHVVNVYGKEIQHKLIVEFNIDIDKSIDNDLKEKLNLEYAVAIRKKLCDLFNIEFDKDSFRIAVKDEFKKRITEK